jgi:ABC-2 type transport system permease protein
MALLVALSGSNLYGQDGTALWQLVVSEHPDAIRADIRGRQASLVLMFAPPAILLSAVMIVVTARYDLAMPVLAGLVAGFGTASGVALLMSVVGVTPGVEPQRRINPTDAGENGLVLQVALWMAAVLLSPTLALVAIAVLSPSVPGWFPFLTLVVAAINGGLVWWGFGNLAIRRLGGHLTETFGRLRYPGTKMANREKSTMLDKISALAEDASNTVRAAKAAERTGADKRP